MTSTNFEVIARNIILPWNNYYGFITCSVVERKKYNNGLISLILIFGKRGGNVNDFIPKKS